MNDKTLFFLFQDITHKLANIMWNDWHKEVRTVAAQTLGKTGHGKEVHDELRERLINGSERDRIDALQKIGHLGTEYFGSIVNVSCLCGCL